MIRYTTIPAILSLLLLVSCSNESEAPVATQAGAETNAGFATAFGKP